MIFKISRTPRPRSQTLVEVLGQGGLGLPNRRFTVHILATGTLGMRHTVFGESTVVLPSTRGSASRKRVGGPKTHLLGVHTVRRVWESIVIIYIWRRERHSWTEFCAYVRVRFVFQDLFVVVLGTVDSVDRRADGSVYVGFGRHGVSVVHRTGSMHIEACRASQPASFMSDLCIQPNKPK